MPGSRPNRVACFLIFVYSLFISFFLYYFRRKEPAENPVDEATRQSNASLLLTPKHVGEAMSAGDPYYRPNCKAHNPFATLKRFKVLYRDSIDVEIPDSFDILRCRMDGKFWIRHGAASSPAAAN